MTYSPAKLSVRTFRAVLRTHLSGDFAETDALEAEGGIKGCVTSDARR